MRNELPPPFICVVTVELGQLAVRLFNVRRTGNRVSSLGSNDDDGDGEAVPSPAPAAPRLSGFDCTTRV